MRHRIRYLSQGEVIEVEASKPTETLLDHLRLTRRLTGTKEGCGEGDCGACTVAIGRLEEGVVRYRPVNACIQLLGQIDGAHVVTIEDLSRNGHLHKVQEAMLEAHGSQCGFCTPGIVMSLFCLHESGEAVTRPAINDALSGNLCRCTGYRPIIDAAEAAGTASEPFAGADVAAALGQLADGADLFLGDETSFLAAPTSVAALAELFARHPDATLVAGATDVGLWITKKLAVLPKVILLNRVAGLDRVHEEDAGLTIGATASFEAVMAGLSGIAPDLGLLLRRIGSKPVRTSGTLGGNIANGSPIGDSPPALIALGAELTLMRVDGTRTLPLEDYFLAYGKQDRRAGEFVHTVFVPRLAAHQRFKALKLSKRYDQDISAVMMALRVDLDGTRITAARLAYGGMAATPKRAGGAEAALVGADLADEASWDAAIAALGGDFTPLTDMRASAAYRMDGAKALLFKALVELAGAPETSTRIDMEAAHV
jgi:xanthine dehydrogenase small subunit